MNRIVVVVVLVAVVGCKSKSEGALEKFATKYSCPEDQVVVKPRPDLDTAATLMPDFSSTPSDEVKADPARLAKWTADQAKIKETWENGYGGYDLFEVTGCGHVALMGCHHPTGRRGGQQTNQVSCDWAPETKQREKEAKQKAKADAKAARREAQGLDPK